MDIQSLTALSDADLLACTKRLAGRENRTTAVLVAHLSEIEARKLYLGEACSSLFTYCVRVLHLSEPAAYNRIQAARLARRFPAVLTSLEQGDVHLAAVRLLAPVLTLENHRTLLAAVVHKSKREIEELVAGWRPQPDVPGVVRKLPGAPAPAPAAPRPSGGLLEVQESLRPADSASVSNGQTTAVNPGPPLPAVELNAVGAHTALPLLAGSPASAVPTPIVAPQRAVVVPLAPERYKVQFTASAATAEKLRRAQELLGHRIPGAGVADVIDLALEMLVRDLEKQKFAATVRRARIAPMRAVAQQGSRSQAETPSRYIPAAVRRAVWERDQGCCAFVKPTGERCTERGALEFDHIRPHADGGGAELWNVRLLCRQHNQYEAEHFFGLWQTDQAHPPSAECR